LQKPNAAETIYNPQETGKSWDELITAEEACKVCNRSYELERAKENATNA